MAKKIIAILISAVMMICPLCTSAADVTVVARYDAGTRVNLSGNADGEAVVTLFTAASDGTVPVFIRQFSADGSYSFDIQMSSAATSGKYNVYVTTASGKATDSFSFVNAQKAADALALLSAASDASSAMRIAETYAVDLGIDITDPNYTPNCSEIFTLLYNQGLRFADAPAFNSAYYKMFALATIHGGSNAIVENMLNKYQSQLGIDFDGDITGDTRLTGEAISRLYSILSATDFVTEFKNRGSQAFAPILNESKMAAAVDAASDWQGVKEAFADFDPLKAMLSDATWNKVSDKNAVYAKMMSYTYNTLSDVKAGFEKAVAFVYEDENRPSKGSSFGGGGSSSPVVTPGYVPETFPTPVDLGFTDYDESHWSYDAVTELVELGIINGYEDKTFRPDQTISRAEFTKLIIQLSDFLGDMSADSSSDEISFDDVSDDAWFYDCVHSAAKAGIVNGDGGNFRPNDSITRQDAAVVIFRFASRIKTIGGNKVFADRGDISDYAREPVAALAASGLISGVGNNSFAPLANLTRAQSAQLLFNVLEFLK